MAVPILAASLAICVILLAVVAFAYVVERSDLQTTTSKYEQSQADLRDAKSQLETAANDLQVTRDDLNGAHDDLTTTKRKLTKARNRLAVAIRRENNLAKYGATATDLVQRKADCLNVVLDAYNQYAYYVDIGMALERALNSSTCIAAGIT